MRRMMTLLLLFTGWGLVDAQEASKPKPVEVAQPARGTIGQAFTYTGTLEAQAKVEIYADATAKVVELRVDEGDLVKKGAVLAKTDSRELVLSLKQAEAGLEVARAQLMKTKATAQVGIEAQAASAQAALDAAKAQWEQAKTLAKIQVTAQLEQAEAGVEVAEANLHKAMVGARQQEIQSAKSTVEQAKASLANAKQNLERVKRLHQQEAISDQDFDTTQTQYEVAHAQYAQAVEQLSLVKEGAREEDIRAAEAQLKQAKASRDLASAAVDTEDWEKQIALAEAQVRGAEANLRSTQTLVDMKTWEHDIAAVQAQFDQAQEQLHLAQKNLADATMTSPINGIVVTRGGDLGDYAYAAGSPNGAPLFTIVDMDVVKAVFKVPEADLSKIGKGRPVLVSTASGQTDIVGKINFISPIVNPDDRTVTVKAEIPNPNYQLLPGMFVEVTVKNSAAADALLLPRRAVFEVADGNGYVFVAESGKARKQTVEIGTVWGEQVEVRGGLIDSAAVIVNGHRLLQDGDLISILK